MKLLRKTRYLLLIASVLLMAGCSTPVLFDPQGPIGAQEKHLLFVALGLMLIVIVPVIILTFVFAFRYRASSKKAKYDPKFTHSWKLEAFWWAVPVVIIAILAAITWKTTHQLDPYKPIGTHKQREQAVEVQVVALPGNWLFIYPQYGIATIREVAFIKGVPVDFYISADAAMNSFQIPALGGQIYSMAGMQTKMHYIADHVGTYQGRSVSFSGPGFDDMRFVAKSMTVEQFKKWRENIQNLRPVHDLTMSEFNKLAAPLQSPEVTLKDRAKHTGIDQTSAIPGQRIAKFMGKSIDGDAFAMFNKIPGGCFYGKIVMKYLFKQDADGEFIRGKNGKYVPQGAMGQSMANMTPETFCQQS